MMSKVVTKSIHPVPADLREQWYQLEINGLEKEVRQWIDKSISLYDKDASSGLDEKKDLIEQLHDGKILCRIVNTYYPQDSFKEDPFREKHSYTQLENIHIFLNFLRSLGINDDLLFDETDLFEQKKEDVLKRDVLLSISLLAAWLAKQGAPLAWEHHKNAFQPNAGDILYFKIRNGEANTDNEVDSLLKDLPKVDDNDDQPLKLEKSVQGWTPLYTASYFGKLALVKALLKAGASPNERTTNGWYPLHAAAYCRHSDVVEYLLAHGADPNVVARSCGTTPLFHSCAKGSMLISEMLLKHKADPNLAGGAHDWKPIHMLVHRGDKDLLAMLLKAGANINLPFHEKNYSPLHLAISDKPEMVETLLEFNPDLEAKTHSGNTALALACKFGLFDAVVLLIKKGARADVKDIHGRTPIQHCVRNGHTSLAKYLADYLKQDIPNEPLVPVKLHPIGPYERPEKPQEDFESTHLESLTLESNKRH